MTAETYLEKCLRNDLAQAQSDLRVEEAKRDELQAKVTELELKALRDYNEIANLRSSIWSKDKALTDCRTALNEKIAVIGVLRELLHEEWGGAK